MAGATRPAIPEHRCLSLVGDAHRTQLSRPNAGLRHDVLHDGQLRLPDLAGIVLHPAWAGKILSELALSGCHGLTRMVKHHRP
jgi:hypothetical protein